MSANTGERGGIRVSEVRVGTYATKLQTVCIYVKSECHCCRPDRDQKTGQMVVICQRKNVISGSA